MAEDDYQYQSKPIPDIYQGSLASMGTASPTTNKTIDTADNLQTSDPFGNSPGLGSPGGSGAIPDGCDFSGVLGDLDVSNIGLPCAVPRSLITANSIALQDESGNIVELSAVNGRLVITFGGPKTITIAAADLANGDEAMFREYEICEGQTIKVLSTEAV